MDQSLGKQQQQRYRGDQKARESLGSLKASTPERKEMVLGCVGEPGEGFWLHHHQTFGDPTCFLPMPLVNKILTTLFLCSRTFGAKLLHSSRTTGF